MLALYVSVITYLFRQEPTPVMIGRFQRLGFRHVELDYRHPDGLCDYRTSAAGQAEEARGLLADHGITPEAYCIGGFNTSHLDVMERAFTFAKGLGVEVITGVAQPAVLGRLDELCAQYGMRYAIENHKGSLFEHADVILPALSGHSDRLGVNFDSGHFHAVGLDAVTEARKLRGKIYHVHLKDSDQTKPLGQGEVGILGFLEELRAQQYPGALSIEQGETDSNSPEQIAAVLRQSLALVRSVLRA